MYIALRSPVRIACSRRSDSGARATNKASERAGKTRGDWGRGRVRRKTILRPTCVDFKAIALSTQTEVQYKKSDYNTLGWVANRRKTRVDVRANLFQSK